MSEVASRIALSLSAVEREARPFELGETDADTGVAVTAASPTAEAKTANSFNLYSWRCDIVIPSLAPAVVEYLSVLVYAQDQSIGIEI